MKHNSSKAEVSNTKLLVAIFGIPVIFVFQLAFCVAVADWVSMICPNFFNLETNETFVSNAWDVTKPLAYIIAGLAAMIYGLHLLPFHIVIMTNTISKYSKQKFRWMDYANYKLYVQIYIFIVGVYAVSRIYFSIVPDRYSYYSSVLSLINPFSGSILIYLLLGNFLYYSFLSYLWWRWGYRWWYGRQRGDNIGE